MKIRLYSFPNNGTLDSDLRPQLAVTWFHFNSNQNDIFLQKRNVYRTKLGFNKIIDEGHYCFLQLTIFKKVFEINITFRESIHEQK
jgi:hypothetical protein